MLIITDIPLPYAVSESNIDVSSSATRITLFPITPDDIAMSTATAVTDTNEDKLGTCDVLVSVIGSGLRLLQSDTQAKYSKAKNALTFKVGYESV